MAKKIKEEIESGSIYLIKKADSYKDSKVILPLEKELIDKFNSGETIEITEQQLKEIGYHRWLISEVK
jgi:hypothetical protein